MKTSLAILIVLIGGFFIFNGNTADVPSQVGTDEKVDVVRDTAPDFSLKDYDGNTHSFSDLSEGKIAVVNSWAVWCPFCKNELDDFAELQESFGDDIVVIAIDRGESLERAKAFTDQIEVTDRMTFLLDPSDSFYKSIGGFSMPETIFVNTKGEIVLHKRGPMDLAEMTEIVNSIE